MKNPTFTTLTAIPPMWGTIPGPNGQPLLVSVDAQGNVEGHSQAFRYFDEAGVMCSVGIADFHALNGRAIPVETLRGLTRA